MAQNKVIFVTPLWDKPRTGPEVYAKYLWETFRDDPDIEFHMVAGGEGESHPRLHLVKPPGGSLALYREVARRALELMHELGPHGVLHLNNSNLHSSLLKSPWPIIGQINDYEAAHFSSAPLYVLRQHGARRFLALWRRNILERKFVHHQAITLCNSEYTRSQICSAYGLDNSSIRVVYKAVDVESFIRPANFIKARDDTGKKAVIFVGTNFFIKGLDVLIGAMRYVSKPMRLVVVGVEAEKFERRFPGLLAFATEQGAEIEFLGCVSRDKIPSLLWSADLFCLPSRVEALGVALLEAIAAGLPCIASRVGGIPEIARHFDSVILTPPDNPRVLATAIDEAIGGPTRPASSDKISMIFGRKAMLRTVKLLYAELLA